MKDTASKTSVSPSAGSTVSQVRVKIADAHALLEGGMGQSRERSRWWFSVRELSRPRSHEIKMPVWHSGLMGDFTSEISIKWIYLMAFNEGAGKIKHGNALGMVPATGKPADTNE